ncbi:MAG: NAD(P)/FAD-dependent oxidoreductase [Ilumatobacteraceae bacterium]|jgi:glycine/D-amino acid oxidase-like deaminating enzyme
MSPDALTPTNGSLWDDTLDPSLRCPTSRMDGAVSCDVAIIGAGLTGLWSAYYLAERLPTLSICVIEASDVGFGASGRNGGWASALLPMSLEKMSRRHGRDAAIAMQRAMFATLDEIERVTLAEGIDAQMARGGSITAARSAPQLDRIRHEIAVHRRFGFDDDDLRLLDAGEAREICAMTSLRGAIYTPHCAAIHPAALTHGIARAVLRKGVRILAPVRATSISPGRVETDRGTLMAHHVVRATEAYTSQLSGQRRSMIPLYSMMVATEPLPDSTWEDIGLTNRPTFDDARHLIIYGQRTADGRFAFGGRGAPYHFGSRIDAGFDTDRRVRDLIVEALIDLFPVLREAEFTHHWGGPLGAPRDWTCSVDLDRRTGITTAGGYVGDGVSTTNLAGRTVAALIAGELDGGRHPDDELLRLPWVGHRSRRWEPEPVRWAGINAGRRAAAIADRAEDRTGRPSRFWGGFVDGLIGR